jgi:hypothetical protein
MAVRLLQTGPQQRPELLLVPGSTDNSLADGLSALELGVEKAQKLNRAVGCCHGPGCYLWVTPESGGEGGCTGLLEAALFNMLNSPSEERMLSSQCTRG